MSFRISNTIFIFIISVSISFSQENNAKSKAEFLYKFTSSKYIEWPKNKSSKTFDVVILNDSSISMELKKLVGKKSLFSGRSIVVTLCKSIQQIPASPSVIYANAVNGYDMSYLMNIYRNKQVLIVGENYGYNTCMINFLTSNGETLYEVNKKLLEQQGLKPLSELLGKANTEGQWKALLQSAQSEIENERKKLEETQKQIEDASKRLSVQQKMIVSGKKQLEQASNIIDSTKDELKQVSDTLETTKNKISEKDSLISIKELELYQKNSELEYHRNVQTGIILILILALSLCFFIYRNYIINKKANQKLTELNQTVTNQKHMLEEKNMEVMDSINYAQRIQQAMIPSESYFKELLPESFIFYRPKDIVSGDFYFIEKKNDEIIVAVVDCTGHGVPGALMSVIGLNLFRQAISKSKSSRPSDIIAYLDSGLRRVFKKRGDTTIKDGMDLAICNLNFKNMEMAFAGVYNPVYHIRGGVLNQIKADKKPIGHAVRDKEYRYNNHQIKLEKDDTIYLFSDGYADQFGGEHGKKFMYSRLRQLLLDINSLSMGEQGDVLSREFENWKAHLAQIDDVCLIGIRV
jgi:serine phosphatase RsbU (regulator of sigma subunit)